MASNDPGRAESSQQPAGAGGSGLLIHACCAPCATVPIERLWTGSERDESSDLALFFFNPNIHPRSEYEHRRAEVERLCELSKVELIEGDYEPDTWERAVGSYADQPEGSHTHRCQACYRLRLEACARTAQERGLHRFCTTLTLSRHKNSKVLAGIGEEVAAETGVAYQHEDFKKRGGETLAVERSRSLGLYRQDYCGCRLSLEEAGRRRRGVVAT